jgi:hypothetical protein
MTVLVRDPDDLVACGANEKIRQAYAYWRSVHPPDVLPGRQHIDPLRLGRLLPLVWLIDVQREPFRLRYRLVGTEIVTLLGREVTGLWLDEAHPDLDSHASYLGRAQAVVNDHIPNWRYGRPNLWQHDTYTTVQNLIMPLASDGRTVDMLFNVSVASR